MVELRNVFRLRIFHVNSERAVKDLRHFVFDRVFARWKINRHPQGIGHALELYRD